MCKVHNSITICITLDTLVYFCHLYEQQSRLVFYFCCPEISNYFTVSILIGGKFQGDNLILYLLYIKLSCVLCCVCVTVGTYCLKHPSSLRVFRYVVVYYGSRVVDCL